MNFEETRTDDIEPNHRVFYPYDVEKRTHAAYKTKMNDMCMFQIAMYENFELRYQPPQNNYEECKDILSQIRCDAFRSQLSYKNCYLLDFQIHHNKDRCFEKTIPTSFTLAEGIHLMESIFMELDVHTWYIGLPLEFLRSDDFNFIGKIPNGKIVLCTIADYLYLEDLLAPEFLFVRTIMYTMVQRECIWRKRKHILLFFSQLEKQQQSPANMDISTAGFNYLINEFVFKDVVSFV